MKNTFFFILILFLSYLNCNTTTKSNQAEEQQDSIFIASQNIYYNEIKNIAYSNDYFFIKNIGENIEFFIIKIENGFSYCFIKEHNNNNIIKRHFIKFDDYVYYRGIEDYSDTASMRKDFEIKMDNLQNYDNTNCELLLSPDFWEIPEYRLQGYSNRKEPTDINKLEELINNLEIFKNYKIDSEYHNKILKELLVLTQINFLMSGAFSYDYDNMQSVDYIFTYKNVKQLVSVDELMYRKTDRVMNRWQNDNLNFLKTKIDIIQKELSKPNVFYFITDDDKLKFRSCKHLNING